MKIFDPTAGVYYIYETADVFNFYKIQSVILTADVFQFMSKMVHNTKASLGRACRATTPLHTFQAIPSEVSLWAL